jgi:hypothetical protein
MEQLHGSKESIPEDIQTIFSNARKSYTVLGSEKKVLKE